MYNLIYTKLVTEDSKIILTHMMIPSSLHRVENEWIIKLCWHKILFQVTKAFFVCGFFYNRLSGKLFDSNLIFINSEIIISDILAYEGFIVSHFN